MNINQSIKIEEQRIDVNSEYPSKGGHLAPNQVQKCQIFQNTFEPAVQKLHFPANPLNSLASVGCAYFFSGFPLWDSYSRMWNLPAGPA